MKKHLWWQIALIILLIGGIMITEYYSPRNDDWRETYDSGDKIPFGTYVLYQQLPELFEKIEKSRQSLYKGLHKTKAKNTALLSITRQFQPGETGTHALMNFVKQGNSAFIAARSFGKHFSQMLAFGTDVGDYNPNRDSVSIHFINNLLPADSFFHFFRAFPYNSFAYYDKGRTTVISVHDSNKPVMLRISTGKGYIYLHSAPQCFTNYNLLKKDNYRYVEAALSYLPQDKLLWDAHYKPYKSEAQTPLRFILSRPSLRMAYYVLITTLLLFIIFTAKRRQRPIPVWNPPKNMALHYIRTVGQLYFRKRNDKQLAVKMLQHWQEYMRSNFYTEPADYSEQEAARIAQKTGVSLYMISRIFDNARNVENKAQISKDELLKLNRRIERFYEQQQS